LRLRDALSVQRGHQRGGHPARDPDPRAGARGGSRSHAPAARRLSRPRPDEWPRKALPRTRHRPGSRRCRPLRSARVDRAGRAPQPCVRERPGARERDRLRGRLGAQAVAILDQGQSLRQSPERSARVRAGPVIAPLDRRAGGALAQALITACVTVIVTSITMIGPLLVDVSRDLGISLAPAGLLAAAAGVPPPLGPACWARLSVGPGPRPMIVRSLGGVGLLAFAAALAPGFAALAGIRFVSGALGSLAPTSLMAAVGDLFPAERRARAMGWFNM